MAAVESISQSTASRPTVFQLAPIPALTEFMGGARRLPPPDVSSYVERDAPSCDGAGIVRRFLRLVGIG